MKSTWLILFLISSLAVLAALLFDFTPLYLIAKPFLMATLLLYFLSASAGFGSWRWYVVIALLFSWAGDIFLLSADWFVAGLVSFLLAHISYMISYHLTGARNGQIKAWDILKFAVIGALLIWIIYPGLGNLLVPVSIYTVVILLMGIWAHKRRDATTKSSFTLVATGAILFVLSDSIIAINKFAFELANERIMVMSVYITAQFLIVQGLLKHTETK